MENLITVIHVLAAAGVIGLVLLQHGKGADMGAAFGSGASGSLFGVSGSSNILSKLTAVCVVIFFCTSLTLAYLASHRAAGGSSVIKVPAQSSSTNTNTAKPDATKSPESTPNASDSSTGNAASGNTAKDVPN
ncbi:MULTISPECIES: preprotein translocase subunit SecG [Methylotenera]|uniref:preprotein translocase subunit SecG n=1 Tax=Methylotenera TaxID=359407 RepID=UPI0003679756|nr:MULTISPECIES: preprotein translocase subunit SecG [Methylotenera]